MCNSYRIKPKRGAAKDLHEKISVAAESHAVSLVRKSDPGVVVTAGPGVEVMRWGFHRSFNPSVNIVRSDKLAGGMWSAAPLSLPGLGWVAVRSRATPATTNAL